MGNRVSSGPGRGVRLAEEEGGGMTSLSVPEEGTTVEEHAGEASPMRDGKGWESGVGKLPTDVWSASGREE